MNCRVFAVAAHPDDIEFCMAGTLLLLARAGCEIHYMNVADGSCGSVKTDAATTARIRLQEARNAAARLGATFHPPIAVDLAIFHDAPHLAKMGSVMREVAPDILLVPSPNDYMEDHSNACRVAVTAAFARCVPNFPVDPPRPATERPVTIYHAQPHGHRDAMNRPVTPDFYIDIGSVINEKTEMLAEHRSQKEWLDHSQGMDAYLTTMQELCREMGAQSGRCIYAEGWRHHNHLGFCAADADPLADILREHLLEPVA
ncbi:MAG: PIG-L family deacetylase [Kiritimatiellae bacterium]|nr:PIG-L family deacetylase [Kiritimatiellia bacterium]